MSKEEKLNNQKCFNLFCDTFGSKLVKQEVWKYIFLEIKDFFMSECISITDEAFAIFTIERNWNIWQLVRDNKEKIKARSGKYTAPNTNIKYGVWTVEGMDRFEKLCKDVQLVRKKSKERKNMEQIYKRQKCHIFSMMTIIQVPLKNQKIQMKLKKDAAGMNQCWMKMIRT